MMYIVLVKKKIKKTYCLVITLIDISKVFVINLSFIYLPIIVLSIIINQLKLHFSFAL